MKRLSYKKNNKIANRRLSKINGGRPPVEDNSGCREITTLQGHSDSVYCVVFHPTAPLLATCSYDKTVRLWLLSEDNSSATCVAILEGHTNAVNSVAFHPTAQLLATGSSGGTAKLWRLSSNN